MRRASFLALLRPPLAALTPSDPTIQLSAALSRLSDEMKANFGRLETQMKALDANVKAEIKDVRTQMNANAQDFKTQMNAFDANVKAEIKDVRTQMNANAQDAKTQMNALDTQMNALDTKMNALDTNVKAEIEDIRSDGRTQVEGVEKRMKSDAQSWFKTNERIIHYACIAGFVAFVYVVQSSFGLEVKVARALQRSQIGAVIAGAMPGARSPTEKH